MAVNRNGAPYGSSGRSGYPGAGGPSGRSGYPGAGGSSGRSGDPGSGPSSTTPGRVGPSAGGGGGTPFTNPISGGGGQDELNKRLLIACAIGGAVGTALAMFLIGALYKSIPNVILYGLVMAVISLGVLIGAVTTTNMYQESFPKTIAVALIGTVIMCAAAALFEFIYEIKMAPKEPEEQVVEEVVTIPTDYIFCIDDSGSMAGELFFLGNDPDGKRDTALSDLLNKIDPASRVGLARYADYVKTGECISPAELDQNQKARLLEVINNHGGGIGTDFEPALEYAVNEFDKLDEQNRKPIIVLMTDGESGYYDIQKWIDTCNQKGITVCGLYLGNSKDALDSLKTLCEGTVRDGNKGFVVNAEDADQLLNAFGTVVEATQTNVTAEDPEYIRFLAGPREGTDVKNVLSIVERLLFFGLLGLLLGLILRVMLGEDLFRQIFIGGICGLLAGAIVEFGYLLGLGSISRIGYLLYGVVVANYTVLNNYIGSKWNTSGGGGAYGGGMNSNTIGQRQDKQTGGRIN